MWYLDSQAVKTAWLRLLKKLVVGPGPHDSRIELSTGDR